MSSKKVCFVVSPISTKGSDIRKEADDLLWLIARAVQAYDFDVVRIDEITKTHEITKEVIKYLRESHLCIIILTGNNPNVFYEAGRRHESGRPYIHLLRDGEKLPFDVSAINTIHYSNIETLDGAKDLISSIGAFVEAMIEEISGYLHEEITLSAIADAIKRIEVKLDRFNRSNVFQKSGQIRTSDPIGPSFTNPRESFLAAIAMGDIDKAESMLDKLETLLTEKEYYNALLYCSQAGSGRAVEIIEEIFVNMPSWMDMEYRLDAIGRIVTFYHAAGREADVIERVCVYIDNTISDKSCTIRQKAELLNQKQRLLFGIKKYEDAMTLIDEILLIAPDVTAYQYNASLVYEALNLLQKAKSIIETAINVDDPDPSHLQQAVEIFIKTKDDVLASETYDKLKAAAPQKAAIMALNPEVRAVISRY